MRLQQIQKTFTNKYSEFKTILLPYYVFTIASIFSTIILITKNTCYIYIAHLEMIIYNEIK